MAELRVLLASFLVAGLAGAVVPAQLAGEYTIDPNGTGSRNYKSFAAAITALQANGVSKPVRFTTASGTIQESWTMPGIQGTSTTNTISFQASMSGTTLQGFVDFKATAHVVLDGFVIERQFSVTGQHILIRNCKFHERVSIAGGNDINVHHNEFKNRGFAFCCVTKLEFHHNRIVAGALLSVNRRNLGIRIYNNVMTGKATVVSMANDAEVDFWHNTISITSDNRWAIEIVQYQSTPATWPALYNNIIDVKGKAGAVRIWNGNARATEFDFNLYSVASGDLFDNNGKVYTTLRGWQLASFSLSRNGANDRSSLVAVARFVSATDLHLHHRSVAVNYAKLSKAVPDDIDGLLRGNWQDLGAYELAGYNYFGDGCVGTGGSTPLLEIQGDVGPGKFTRFNLTKAKPSAALLFLIGIQNARFNLGGSCDLLTWPLAVLQAPPTSSTGTSYIQFNLPLNQAILGLTAFTQFAVADPGAGGLGFAMTRGASIRL